MVSYTRIYGEKLCKYERLCEDIYKNRGVFDVKKLLSQFQNTVVFILKAILFIGLLAIFFGLFSIPNWQLLVLNRTSGTTLVTFVAVGLAMLAAYGRFDIGKRKSKPIIYSLGLAVVITDVVTYLQLSIMNTNSNRNTTFVLEDLGILVLVIVLQIVYITLMTYFGNFIYFKINKPENSCIITGTQTSLDQIYYGVAKFKLQYKVEYIVDYRDPEIYKYIEKCDTVFLFDVPMERRTELVEYCYRRMRNIYFNPEISDVVEINAEHVVLDDISMVAATVKELSLEQRIIKRGMDIIVSLLGMIITSPIWLICALAIKLYDGGPVFFKQERATKDGKIFKVYKFRTMRENVINHSVTSDDDRITPVGKVLRKIRIDELPQIFNILKGEMSLVGPRPEMLENVYDYTRKLPEFSYRLRVKAGLTGYAQIAGKYNTSPRDKLVLDLMYIENYSVWKDIKLILQTLIVFFKSDSTEAFGKKIQAKFTAYEEHIENSDNERD